MRLKSWLTHACAVKRKNQKRKWKQRSKVLIWLMVTVLRMKSSLEWSIRRWNYRITRFPKLIKKALLKTKPRLFLLRPFPKKGRVDERIPVMLKAPLRKQFQDSQLMAKSFSLRRNHKGATLRIVTLHSKSYFETLSCALANSGIIMRLLRLVSRVKVLPAYKVDFRSKL